MWLRQRCAGVVLTCACCTSACCQGWCVCFEVECYTPGKAPCVAHLSMIAQGTPRMFTRKGAGLKLYQERRRKGVMLTGRDRITSVSPVLVIHEIILLCKWQLLLQGWPTPAATCMPRTAILLCRLQAVC